MSVFQNIVEYAHKNIRPLYECADFHEVRTEMMADYAQQVLTLGEFGRVKQKGALSSFHIPDKHERDPA